VNWRCAVALGIALAGVGAGGAVVPDHHLTTRAQPDRTGVDRSSRYSGRTMPQAFAPGGVPEGNPPRQQGWSLHG